MELRQSAIVTAYLQIIHVVRNNRLYDLRQSVIVTAYLHIIHVVRNNRLYDLRQSVIVTAYLQIIHVVRNNRLYDLRQSVIVTAYLHIIHVVRNNRLCDLRQSVIVTAYLQIIHVVRNNRLCGATPVCNRYGCIYPNTIVVRTQQTRDIDPMLDQYWSTGYDAAPTSVQHLVDVSCLLGNRPNRRCEPTQVCTRYCCLPQIIHVVRNNRLCLNLNKFK